MSSVNLAALIDVPCNWRRLMFWQQSNRNLPDIGVLKNGLPCLVDQSNVLITNVGNVIDVRDWLDGNATGKFEMRGRFQFQTHAYRVDRSLVGVNFSFVSADDALYFKMRWF